MHQFVFTPQPSGLTPLLNYFRPQNKYIWQYPWQRNTNSGWIQNRIFVSHQLRQVAGHSSVASSSTVRRVRGASNVSPQRRPIRFRPFCHLLDRRRVPAKLFRPCGRSRWPSSWCGSVWTSGIYTCASSSDSLESALMTGCSWAQKIGRNKCELK